ncbi:aromatic amino acid hydrolase AAH2 [Toxoplasma gondii COUG]|uniref:phenylalanine 4-monooxygenase n=1 Tax=Toxoplasma gondii COUG TaxID=1074873 RepID=A0A2G8XLZ9_TOXGO|nr:aromatic amino acid hydrolase AAH2 [Toxoplasma gondii COUG]
MSLSTALRAHVTLRGVLSRACSAVPQESVAAINCPQSRFSAFGCGLFRLSCQNKALSLPATFHISVARCQREERRRTTLQGRPFVAAREFASSVAESTTTANGANLTCSFSEGREGTREDPLRTRSPQQTKVQGRTSDGVASGGATEGPSTRASTRRLSINNVSCQIEDRVGAISELAAIFAAYNVNITEIRSSPDPLDLRKMTVSISFEGEWESENATQLIDRLGSYCVAFTRGSPADVPWFPRSPEDLDRIASHTLDAGKDLEADHPGFHDVIYRKRRQEIASCAENHKAGRAVGIIDYTPRETATWKHVWGILTDLYPTLACNEYNEVLAGLRDARVYGPDTIPQVAEVNEYIKAKTGFTLRPVPGLLSARDFMNALAFRTFFSTQYIRHHSAPLYTPEPDVVHELLGHAPLLANPDFADFSQLLGLASLGASEEDIARLQRLYWFSVEFGLLCNPGNEMELAAYGAGLLSSPGELRHSTCPTNGKLVVRQWRPEDAAQQDFPITTYQPVLFVAESLKDARDSLLRYIQNHIHKPFATRYDNATRTLHVSTDVHMPPVSLKI